MVNKLAGSQPNAFLVAFKTRHYIGETRMVDVLHDESTG
jgi:hypothetical protein